VSKVQTAIRLVRAGRWGDIAAISSATSERRIRRGQLQLNRLSQGRFFGNVALDAALRRPPGMVSMDQRRYLFDYARRDFTGSGEIVDLGCWLGSSTVPLAAGLDSNPHVAARVRSIYAHDLFRWDVVMGDFVKGTPLEGRYEAGDDFQDAFLHYVAPWRHRVKVRPGDLGTLTWPDGPIEFLFVDAMKSWELANNIARQFFAALMPGTSLVFHHDFAHYYTPWIPLLMHRLRDYLVPIQPIPRTAVLFRATAPIPTNLLERRWSFSDFDDAEIEDAFTYAVSCTGPQGSPDLMVSKLMLRVHQGDLDRAVWERDEAQRQGMALGAGFGAFESELAVALAGPAREL
jgi:hypothetical protein